MSLRLSCTLLSPLYDLAAGPLFRTARQRSLAALPGVPELRLVSDEPALESNDNEPPRRQTSIKNHPNHS